jgi:hypothetical protein
MKRSDSLIDFALVALSATTILMSLLPLALSQQYPVQDLKPNWPEQRLTVHRSDSTELIASDNVAGRQSASQSARPRQDPKLAVARWQQEAEAFYARRDEATLPVAEPRAMSNSRIEMVGFQVPTESPLADAKSTPVVAKVEGVSKNAAAKNIGFRNNAARNTGAGAKHLGLVFSERRTPMTFLLALCGGVLMALAYLQWSRRTPTRVPGAIEFFFGDAPESIVQVDAKWVAVSQNIAVKLRRATLGGLVITALAMLIA